MDESGTDTDMDELVNRFRAFLTAHTLWPPKDNETVLLNKLKRLVSSIKWSPTDAANLFESLLKRYESKNNDITDLLSWLLKMLHCIEINFITPSWKCQIKKKVQDMTVTDENLQTYQKRKTLIELVQDETVTDEDLEACLNSDAEKQLDEILEEIRQQKLNQIDEKLLADVKDVVSSVCKALTQQNNRSQLHGLEKDLLKLCQAAEKVHFRPRVTQMVSWCIMALSETGRLIQVGTGEGKSCIVAMFAAYRAMRGQKVDVMSSSAVLAERDVEDWKKFYNILNISVNCNVNKSPDNLKKCYEHDVVYGTPHEFAGHWLHHRFERMDIFGKRKFECAIVDEVDSLMLDKGHHMVYIGSDMPALQHLNPLLAFIWATVNRCRKTDPETTVEQKNTFSNTVFKNLDYKDVDEFTILQLAEDTGLLAKGSAKGLKKTLSPLTENIKSITAEQLAKFFVTIERFFPSCQVSLHFMNKDGETEELNNTPQREMAEGERVPVFSINRCASQCMSSDEESVQKAAEEIKKALQFTPCELSKDNCSCYVPGFLSDLVESKLNVWIENAFYAQTMARDHEYVLEEHGIVPVDYSCTGVIENFRVKTDGLQQFLEMKHTFKLSDMTAITNYMSNVGLFQKYRCQIFGISGTLGQEVETETLQKIYEGIKTCQIPSFKRRKLFEVEGVVVDNEEEWTEEICKVITAETNSTPYRAKRAVLVVCETIKRAKVLYNALGNKVQKRLYISNNMDNSAIFANELKAGDVIIATNLAGRGTDLKVSESVKRAGGLFVVQTFLPKNARVEAQAFGRTARQGSPGSAQLIVCSNHLPETLQLLVLKEKLQSLLRNIEDVNPPHHCVFLMQFRRYQKRHSDVPTKDMSLTLLLILTVNSSSEIETLKKIRQDSVAAELSSYLESDVPRIKKKEELFNQYLDMLDEVHTSRNNKPADADLAVLNEFWGMWLLTNFNNDDSIIVLKHKLTNDLKTAKQKLRQRESPLSNLHHYTAFGNELWEKGHLTESIEMYTKAIQEDHCWAAIAYYNRAFISLSQQEGHQTQSCINQALEDLQNALKSVELYCEQIEVTRRYSKQQISNICCDDSVSRFDSHIFAKYKVFMCLKRNITEAIQELERARDASRCVKLQKSSVYCLVSLVNFLPMVRKTLPSLHHIWFRDHLKIEKLMSDPSFDISSELKCLKSLGLAHVFTLDTMFSCRRLLFETPRVLHHVLHRLMDRFKRFFKTT